ncbi:hypothetical protein EDB85DRAFT_2292499 [Lactarius pseudohatsudake]|nr:hypothetical protein EDB85DRAFT_2292499 [Lactarius pseudohatsudake]
MIDEDLQTYAQRPDLRYGSQYLLEPGEGCDDGSASERGHPRSGASDAGDDNEGPGPAPNNDSDDNPGQILSGDENEDAPARHPGPPVTRKRKRKDKQPERGSFRAEVNATRVQTFGTIKKRKTPPVEATRAVTKRIKEATAGGLSSNWKNKTKHLRPPRSSVASSIVNTDACTEEANNSKGRRPPGEFDDDEREAVMAQFKTKSTGPRSAGNTASIGRSASTLRQLELPGPSRETDQMSVTIRTGTTSSKGSQDSKPKSTRKPRPTVMDLPLPRTGRHLQNWRKKFVPLLISWAGSQADPFGTNNRIDGAVASVWKRVYNDIVIGDAEMDIVVIVAENTLNNWRSDIGKAGYRAVLDLWDTKPSDFSSEDRAQCVAENLNNFQFLYKSPDATHGRGGFCSLLISKVFALHLRKISTGRPVAYIPQVGGLALAAAAVERGLCIFKTGEDALKLERDPETGRSMPRNIRGVGFTESLWGSKAREFVKTTTRLTDKHWDDVTEHAAIFMTGHALESDEESSINAETESLNPRAAINLDWCVRRFLYPSQSSLRALSFQRNNCSLHVLVRAACAYYVQTCNVTALVNPGDLYILSCTLIVP